MEQAIEHRGRGRGDGQKASPIFERPVAGEADAASLVGTGNQAEQQLGGDFIQRCEAYLVNQDRVVAEQAVDAAG